MNCHTYSGHIINLPQDVASFANSLPRLPSELDVVIVRKGAMNSHRDFHVRRAIVLHALQWLIVNKYYHNIRINLEAVAMLPKNSNLSGLHTVSLDSTEEKTGLPEILDEEDDPYNSHLCGSFVPSTNQRMTEQETVCTAEAATPASDSCTYSFMASLWISSNQRVQHRGIHVTCFSHVISNWGSRLLDTSTDWCHHRQLPQAHDDVRRWKIC